MASPFLWPVLVSNGLRSPAPVILGLRPPMTTCRLLKFLRKETFFWHASNQLFDSFDPNKIGSNASKYGFGFYFCRTASAAKGAVPNAKYLYKVKLEEKHFPDFIKFDLCISMQSGNIQSAAQALSSFDPLSRHVSYLDASGNYLRLAAENAASTIPTQYSRDVLMRYGVRGFLVVDGRSESDDLIVVYDENILQIVSIEFV